MRARKTKRRVKLLSHNTVIADLGISPAKYYADVLPELDVVRFGRRSLVTDESYDRVIERHRVKLAAEPAR